MTSKIQRMSPILVMAYALLSGPVFPSDWPNWRGFEQRGVSTETGLISDWNPEGENLLWRVDFTGRSTPVVLNGRAYVIGRVGEGSSKQEVVACFDVSNGNKLWEHRFNVFLTTVPFSRVGWANLTGDPETGNIFAHGVGGLFICFDPDGNVLWQHSLTEEFGRMSGYGGRTQTPVVDGDFVFIGFVSSSWGDQAVPRHRYFAFDKENGELVWVATPGGRPFDMNTYSMPVTAVIDGQRVLVGGNADGSIDALHADTGQTKWRFSLSKRGINSSVVVSGNRVFASHSEENIDSPTMGRVVCIDGTGSGDVTKTHEVWRVDQLKSGFPSPAIHQGRLYVVDNSANLYSLDSETGEMKWEFNLGTVGRGSPVLADGKLFITETNGNFHILKPEDSECQSLSKVTLKLGERTAEIFSSPAISGGRIFFATEEGLYCLAAQADRRTQHSRGTSAAEHSDLAHLQLVPADLTIQSGKAIQFRVRALNSKGQTVSLSTPELTWTLSGLSGSIDPSGRFHTGDVDRAETGIVKIEAGAIAASSRVRLLPRLPWVEDFESIEIGKTPVNWIGASSRFAVKSVDGNKVLSKPYVKTGIQRSYVYTGTSEMSDYIIQADLMGNKEGRRVPDMGLIANRYAMALMGLRQELQVHSWVSELRMAKSVPFSWEPNLWYTMKMQVETSPDKAIVRGKVWPKGETEPETWTLEVEDEHPNQQGTPGIFGQSYAEIYYDNLKVTKSEK